MLKSEKLERKNKALKLDKKEKTADQRQLAVKQNRNCLFCVKFRNCKDQNKSFDYVCGKFTGFDKSELEDVKKVKVKKKTKESKKAKVEIINKKFKADYVDYASVTKEFIEQANLNPLPPDLRIDDRDLPQAKNFFEFTTHPKFLNIRPFAKQIEVSIHLFAEFCRNKKCTDLEYVYAIPKDAEYEDILERVQLLHHGICPKCGYRKSEMLADGFKVPTELDLLIGQRAGKSAVTAMIVSYQQHGYLKMQNAPKVFGLLDNEILEYTLVALTATKAKELMYSKIEGYLKETPWFQQYNSMLDDYGAKYGEELYRIRDTFASYRCRSLLIKASDPDKRKLRGPTRSGFAIDELGWFLSGAKGDNAVKFSAPEILKSLSNSLKTVRNSYYKMLKQGMDGILPPIECNISSPSSKKDLMVRRYNRSLTSDNAVGFHYASWEFNPELSRKDFKEEFKDDPLGAMRDFGAVPPNSSAPFISDIEHIKGIVEKTRRNTVNFIPQTIVSMGGKQMGSGKIIFTGPKDNIKRIMAIDAGSVDNSFAIVCAYYDEVLQKPVYDTFVEIPASHDLPLNYNDIFNEIIGEMVERLNVQMMVADRFQSIKFIHDVEAQFDIKSEIYSVKYGDMDAFRGDLLDHNIIIPKPEAKPSEILALGDKEYPHSFRHHPIAHFLYQLITVQDLKKEVIKGEGLTDDLFRAATLAYAYLVDAEYQEYFTGTTQVAIKTPYIAGILAPRSTSLNTHRAQTMGNNKVLVAITSRGRS